MSFSALLDRHLIIQRQEETPAPGGGTILTFGTLLSNIPCAVSPASAFITAQYASRGIVVDHHIYIGSDLDSLLSGGLQVGDQLTQNGVNYGVKAVKKFSNEVISADAIYQIDCERSNT